MPTHVAAHDASLFARLALTVKRTWAGLLRHHAFDAAAAMTFYFFLSLVPLFAFLGFILGRVALSEGLDTFAPILGVVPRNVSMLIRDELSRMGDAGGVAPFSFLGFVYLTSSGTHNLMDLLEVATGAPPRGWWRQRAIAILWNFAGIFVVVALIAAFLAFAHRPEIASAARGAQNVVERTLTISVGPAEKWVAIAGTLALGASALALFFRIAVTHPPGISRRVWPGAIVAVVLGLLVSMAFAGYVATLGKYAVYYGSLAAVAVLLMWLYLTSLAMLVGAEINAQLEGLRPPFGHVHHGH